MAGAKHLILQDWKTPRDNTNLYPYTTPSPPSTNTFDFDAKAYDIEVEMARALIVSDPNARPKHFRNTFEECIFIFTVMVATASTTFLQGVIIINTATIGRDLIMTPAQITWIAAAIGLASGSFMLFFGKTADLFGRKIQLLTGMAFLSMFSLLTAFAPTPMAMNILCGFLGLGTAMIAPPAIGTLFATYHEGQRLNKATGALGAGNPLGFILGSFSSGIATKYFSWRISFIVVSIFFFLMTLLAIWTMPSIPRAGDTSLAAKNFDYLGTILTIAGMALVAAALTQGPEDGWRSFRVILMLIIGIFCLVSFGLWESVFPQPLLDPAVWKNATFTLCVLCTFFGYMSFITNQFWICLYMQDVQGIDSLQIAVRLLPQALVGVIWSYIGQYLASRISGRIIMGIGSVAYVAGASLVFFIRENTSYWAVLFPALCITVIGADFQFIVSNLYISKQMPSQSSLAAGVLQTASRLSVSIGLSVTTAVYGSVAQTARGQADRTFPYERAYICSIAFATAGLLFVPFMQIGRQGKKLHHSPTFSLRGTTAVDECPRTASEHSNQLQSERSRSDYVHDPQEIIGHKPSQSSMWSAATAGSMDSYFPRWSWEHDTAWPGERYRHGATAAFYEICIKCLQERRVMLECGKETPSHHGSVNSGLEPSTTSGARETRVIHSHNFVHTTDHRVTNYSSKGLPQNTLFEMSGANSLELDHEDLELPGIMNPHLYSRSGSQKTLIDTNGFATVDLQRTPREVEAQKIAERYHTRTEKPLTNRNPSRYIPTGAPSDLRIEGWL